MFAESPARKTSVFLSARWSNLAILSYTVPPEVLEPLLPPGCGLDNWDGRAYVSLVAFDFLDTRVRGISWPGLRNFPEVNLRFYVRHNDQRGVCFIREYVPSRGVALVARLFYNEPYSSAAMTSRVNEQADSISILHQVDVNGRRQTIQATGGKPAFRPAADSIEHHFKEHNWGCGTSRSGGLIRFRVEHEAWEIYPIQSVDLDWDWPAAYGERWNILRNRQPDHALLAAGSEVRVFRAC